MDENIKKKRCWACGSLNTIKWSKRNNKQRFKCKDCSIFFTSKSAEVSKSNRFIWFKKWVIGRRTIDDLSKESSYSEKTLRRFFSDYLSQPPRLSVYPSEKVNLLIDGTYFSNGICLVLYRDATIKFTQLYRLTNGEHYHEIREDLENLLALGVQIESVTCDGHKSILKAVKNTLPNVTLQRCLVHIQRDGRIWLTKHPKSMVGYDLKQITSKLHLITTHDQLSLWLLSFIIGTKNMSNISMKKATIQKLEDTGILIKWFVDPL